MRILAMGHLNDNIFFECKTCGSIWLASEEDCIDEMKYDRKYHVCMCPKCHKYRTSDVKLTDKEVAEKIRLYNLTSAVNAIDSKED